MDLNHKKELFSQAYVRAVAAVAGYMIYEPTPDLDSVDLGFAAQGGQGTTRSPKLEMQLKCTSCDIVAATTVAFPLKIKNYDDLRHENYQVPRILVVVTVPNDIENWIIHSEDELLLRHCAYWFSLRGLGPTSNSETVTINIPRASFFNPASLADMMSRISAGGLP